jgi:predicted GH43/DUF377 family glycosyl hydrolase
MPIYRSSENPILQPKDVPPSRPGYEVIGVINTGVARMGNEVILLLRVVERPINSDPSVNLRSAAERYYPQNASQKRPRI